jgi:hypothetical protein
MRALGRGLLFLIATMVAAGIVYGLWIDLVVLRPGCGPYSCGWPGQVTWDHWWLVFAFFFVVTAVPVWLVVGRAPYLVATFAFGTVLWVAWLGFVGGVLDQHDRCAEDIGGGPIPECGTIGELTWYFGDGWPVRMAFLLLVGALLLMGRRRRSQRLARREVEATL